MSSTITLLDRTDFRTRARGLRPKIEADAYRLSAIERTVRDSGDLPMQERLGRIVETYVEHPEFQEWLLKPGAFLTRSIIALAAIEPHDLATIWALMQEGLGRLPGPSQLPPHVEHKEGLGRFDPGMLHLMSPVLYLAPHTYQREQSVEELKFSAGTLDRWWLDIVDIEWRPIIYTGYHPYLGGSIRDWARWAGEPSSLVWYREVFVGRSPLEFPNPYAPWVELGSRYGIQIRALTDGDSTLRVDWNIPFQDSSRHIYSLFLGEG